MGFHLDTTGNIWLGSGEEDDTLSDAITAGPPNFYVTNTGSLYAVDGSIGGITIDSTGIYANYSSGSTGFKIFSSDGSAEFEDVIARGTISGTVDSTLSGGSSGYLQSGTGTTRVRLGAGGGGIDFLNSSATKGIIDTTSDALRIRNYSSTTDKIQIYGGGLGGTGTVEINAEVLDINGSASAYNEIQLSGFSNINISGNSGTPGQLLTKTNTGIAWQSSTGHTHSGYTFPNSGTLLSDDTHSHDSSNTVLTSNNIFTGHTTHQLTTTGTVHGINLDNVTTLGNTNVLTSGNHSHGEVGNINSITSNYNNNVTAYNTAFSAAGAFNLYNTINSALSNKANNSQLHNNHNYFTNADVVGSHHSHNGYVSSNTFNDHTGSASAHGQYVYYNDYLNHISNFNSHTSNNNNAHGINNKANNGAVNTLSTNFYSHLDLYHGGSDERLKTNIVDTTFGLEYIKSLRPVDYNFKQSIADEFMGEEDSHYKTEFVKQKHGFIAQEVQAASLENHASNNAFGGVHYREAREGDTLENILNLDMNQFIGPLVKAVQELSGMIELLEARIDELEGV